jgi:hypothetical protein
MLADDVLEADDVDVDEPAPDEPDVVSPDEALDVDDSELDVSEPDDVLPDDSCPDEPDLPVLPDDFALDACASPKFGPPSLELSVELLLEQDAVTASTARTGALTTKRP